MTATIILPPLKAAGFDLVWFGVVILSAFFGIAMWLPNLVYG